MSIGGRGVGEGVGSGVGVGEGVGDLNSFENKPEDWLSFVSEISASGLPTEMSLAATINSTRTTAIRPRIK